ncbi:MAG: AAA family ATPase [Chloroflexota bacterium]|nr:AAA family ATPase [Chloroflexota bacterium]
MLFADLVGFTPFAEERDAEEVRETLSRYFELASDVIARYGGTVEKFIGDAVMAVWGAPVAHEDDAERAVRAGLELVDAVTGLAAGIQARVGILTGEAAVTLGATNQGMVAGDLVNTASRLQSVAAPGAVLVGEGTFRAASRAIAFVEAGEQALKGKQSPVAAWQALRVVAEVGGRNRSAGLEAPFVGRADELRLLKDLYHATGREKRARLVSIMGPAGIGKSRLAWEFSKYTDGVVETVYWHSGRSPAYGEGISFWALGEMVRQRCGLLEGDDELTTRAKVAEAVERWVSDAGERAWIERALLTLLGVETGMPAEELFAAWRSFFERIAQHGTVALVFEDTHFADAGLLDFIDHLLEWSRGVPLYIVTLARPELLERRPDWGAGKRNFVSLYLEPLPESEMRELLGGLVPGLPESAVTAIVERADGIPLYAVETVRMLVAEGRLVERDGVYAPVGDLTALAVPDTLSALIASRLDGLEPADRQLIHDAAVLGQSFTQAALAAVSGVSEAELDRRLPALVRRELLRRELDPRSPERGQYVFVQALIREVAYNTLSRRDRKARHLAAARYFEQLGSDELAGVLARHYLAAQAHASPGAEAEALAAQARIALRAAIDRSSALGAHEQVIGFTEEAMTVTADPAERADLLERAGNAANALARSAVAERYYRQAIELRLELGDRRGTARATAALAWALLDAHHAKPAIEMLERAIEQFAELSADPVLLDMKARVLARGYMFDGQFQRAERVADEVLPPAEHADMVPIIANALVAKGSALAAMGRLREGIALIGAGEQLARDRELTDTLTFALLQGGYHLAEVDTMAALAKYREGLTIARRLGNRPRTRVLTNNIGYTGFLAGDWDGALAELDAALGEDVEPGERVWLAGNALNIRACRGEDVSAALRELEEIAASLPENPAVRIPPLEVGGLVALSSGDLKTARRKFHVLAKADQTQAAASYYMSGRAAIWAGDAAAAEADLTALNETGLHGRVAEVRRATLRAGIAALSGARAEAQARYREALRGWRDLRMPWDEALTGIDVASVLTPAEPDYATVVDATRQSLERLGARPFVERLDLAVAKASEGRSPAVLARPAAPEESQAVV